jgi:hypothetical protein
MLVDIAQLLRQPESEGFDRKSALDPTSSQDYLEFVADLVAMANTRGGGILVGTRGSSLPALHLPLFDSARIDDKVNSLVEPRVGGIRSSILDEDFAWVEIEKSVNPPHIFKHDVTYMNKSGKNATVFRKGDIFVRHSSKSERANRVDFERWFEERQRRLFENVKLVFDASPQAHIQIAEGPSGMPVRIDPDAPGAQPVYDLLTPEPFRDLRQELTGALKAWKTSRQLLNEPQLYKAYSNRSQIADPETLELLLRSGWERYTPGYYWAAKLNAQALVQVLTDVIRADHYPASQEALKIAALLPRDHAKSLFHLIEASPRKSFKKAAKKFEPVLRARAKKYEALVDALCPGQRLIYSAGEGTKEVKIEAVNETTFEEVLSSLLEGRKENRGVFKAAELLVYGRRVSLIEFSTLEASGAIAEEGEAPASVPIESGPESKPQTSD